MIAPPWHAESTCFTRIAYNLQVNGEPLHGTLMMLEHGDKVEVVTVPQEQPAPFSEPAMPLQAQRAALSRMFDRAPSGQPAMA